jgi:uncharacterized protein YyaL (SSP411 family)
MSAGRFIGFIPGYKGIHDSPGSSGNGMAIQLLLKMWALTDDKKYNLAQKKYWNYLQNPLNHQR